MSIMHNNIDCAPISIMFLSDPHDPVDDNHDIILHVDTCNTIYTVF